MRNSNNFRKKSDSMSFREEGKAALATILKNKKDISKIEGSIYSANDNEKPYKLAIYQAISDLTGKETVKEVVSNIQKGRTGWKHPSFSEMAKRIDEQNSFIENPFEVEEGVHTCQRCNSKRVFSYNKQCRGGDEGTSVFCECVACHCKWTERG